VSATRVAVVVDSRYGSTLALAEALAAGAEREGAKVRLRRVALAEPEYSVETGRESYVRARAKLESMPQAGIDDLRWADGIVFGSPTRYGLMSTPLRAFIDEVAPLWREGALIGKVGAAFTSSGGMHSGHEMTLINTLLPFLQHGMLILGVPHSVPELVRTKKGGSPYGASVVTGFDGHDGATAEELAIAGALGARVARVAAQIEPEPAPVSLS
jgi:NAD(P)H dehydrogenase (quinone)